ncbi:isochorismatase family protein [Marinomonas foliarum]|uniref:Isochorismatase family protein n=1 Tax=Marinomonas foliarum TaxID=491950 RepID=A0ABX7IR05_9GAMM|nr:isochorismatase family protein [Marinomonas foliarum]QRV23387.1 isochorismatase family protein [Marinomonas foliarum]|tara:strand:- start:11440 stop:12129 length:690 start_codon:yes stop_codon:yes gene_type:complete
MSDNTKLEESLKAAFEEATKLYQNNGFQRRVGFGKRPALINVDLANAWTRPGNPFSCDKMDDQIIPGVQELLKAFREKNLPVVHVTTCYQVTDREDPNTDMGLWHDKIPVEVVNEYENKDLWAIDSRIAPIEGEQVLIKKRASSFQGTYLSGFLKAAGVDTIIVTGVTASACVRTTICDGLADGFRTIAVKECIGDRIPGAVEWNLFDIDAKFGDVETVETCVDYLNKL